jgi:hypothetical protein
MTFKGRNNVQIQSKGKILVFFIISMQESYALSNGAPCFPVS